MRDPTTRTRQVASGQAAGWPAESGRASIEFLVFAIIILLPVLLLTQSLWAIQAASMATNQAARDAARVFVTHQSLPTASRVADQAARSAMAEHGITTPLTLTRSCQPVNRCLEPGSLVRIQVTSRVTLWQAPVFRNAWPVSVPVSSHATWRVSNYGGVG